MIKHKRVLSLTLAFAVGIGKLIDWQNVKVSFGHNAIQFENHPLERWGDLTLGNTTHYGGPVSDWAHEMQHTFQSQQLGPLYLPSNMIGQALAITASAAIKNFTYGQALTTLNWNERGPYAYPPRPWR